MKNKQIIKEYKFLWKSINNNIDFIPRSIKECHRDVEFKEFTLNKFELFDAFYEVMSETHIIPSYRCNLPQVRKKRVRLLKSIEQFCDSVSEMTIDEINQVEIEDIADKNCLMLFTDRVSKLIDLYGEYNDKERDFLQCYSLNIIKNSSKFAEYYYSMKQRLFDNVNPLKKLNEEKDIEGSHSPA